MCKLEITLSTTRQETDTVKTAKFYADRFSSAELFNYLSFILSNPTEYTGNSVDLIRKNFIVFCILDLWGKQRKIIKLTLTFYKYQINARLFQ